MIGYKYKHVYINLLGGELVGIKIEKIRGNLIS